MKKKKIVIAEDDEVIVEILREGLEGYEIYSALNGREALELIQKEMPDLIIADVMMPEMNGVELNRRLKREPGLCQIPVVIITAKPDMQKHFSCVGENEVAGFLEKPFTIEVLQEEIKRNLEKAD